MCNHPIDAKFALHRENLGTELKSVIFWHIVWVDIRCRIKDCLAKAHIAELTDNSVTERTLVFAYLTFENLHVLPHGKFLEHVGPNLALQHLAISVPTARPHLSRDHRTNCRSRGAMYVKVVLV